MAKANLLSDSTASALGLSGDPTPNDALRALNGKVNSVRAELDYQVGDIAATARSSFKSGWLRCDDSVYSRNQYPALHSILAGPSNMGSLNLSTGQLLYSDPTGRNESVQVACSNTIFAVLLKSSNTNNAKDKIIYTKNGVTFTVISLGYSRSAHLFYCDGSRWYICVYDNSSGTAQMYIDYTDNLESNAWTRTTVGSIYSYEYAATMAVHNGTIGIVVLSSVRADINIYTGTVSSTSFTKITPKTNAGNTIVFLNYSDDKTIVLQWGPLSSSVSGWVLAGVFRSEDNPNLRAYCIYCRSGTVLSDSSWTNYHLSPEQNIKFKHLQYAHGIWCQTIYNASTYNSKIAKGINITALVASTESTISSDTYNGFRNAGANTTWTAAMPFSYILKTEGSSTNVSRIDYAAKYGTSDSEYACYVSLGNNPEALLIIGRTTNVLMSTTYFRVPNITIDKSTAWIKAT